MPSYGQVPGSNTSATQASSADEPWVSLMKDAFSRSTTYFDNNYRKQFEDGLRMFQSKHPSDSKYNSDAYKYRSRLFRPKTRSMVRKNEATAALAFFSSPDVLSISPVLDHDSMQAASSAVMKDLMTYRLQKTIPWFLTVIGGLQDALVVGLVCSFQYWCYRTQKETQVMQGQLPTGEFIQFEQEVPVPVEDMPVCELIPIENIRFDPAAKWFDVAGTSPYLILQRPMYVRDVLDMMEDEGEYAWRRLDKTTILQARIQDNDPIRQARDGNKEDPQTQTSTVNEFDVVMVHLNFCKVSGGDYTWYSLKDQELLTTPSLVKETFKHCDQYGDRPVRIGFTVMETHKAVPDSATKIGAHIQVELNENVNQRMDNVKFVLNKRYIVRRGANIDVESLMRNVPGGATMANNVEDDIKTLDWQDVTSSAYQEQDRMNVDYDELLGSFAQSSILTNRKLNETVGGMRMMAQGANVITEYQLRMFAETWMEPVLRQLMKMEQHYETDEVALAVAGQRLQAFQKAGINQISDQLLRQELTLTVHVGMGATDPDTRFARFNQAMAMYTKISMEGPADIDLMATRTELFGLAGFRDSARFFQQADPRFLQAQKMMQQAQQIAEQEGMKVKAMLTEKEVELNKRETEIDLEGLEVKMDKKVTEMQRGIMTAAMERKESLRAVNG